MAGTAGTTGKSVLIVDQDISTRRILKTTISMEFDSVVDIRQTPDGEEAIEMMLDYPASLVISDAQPLTTSGIEIAHIIKDPYNGWPGTRFILTSEDRGKACELVDLALRAWNIGVEFFCKPLDLSMVLLAMGKKRLKA